MWQTRTFDAPFDPTPNKSALKMRCFVTLTTLIASLVGLASAKPEKIRAVSSPIFHYYLQAYPKDKTIPVMGPEGSAEYFNIGGTIQSTNSSMYLNIGSDTTSYKTLTFVAAGDTKAWGLEGDTIITTTGSSFGRRKYFKVLPSYKRRGSAILTVTYRAQLPCLPAGWELLAGLSTDW
jgi:hypothetical protein